MVTQDIKENKELKEFIRQAKRELKYTVAHKRYIILGYNLINLDSMAKDGIITENQRRIAHNELKLYCDLCC